MSANRAISIAEDIADKSDEGVSVLVVDDQAPIRESMVITFRREGDAGEDDPQGQDSAPVQQLAEENNSPYHPEAGDQVVVERDEIGGVRIARRPQRPHDHRWRVRRQLNLHVHEF